MSFFSNGSLNKCQLVDSSGVIIPCDNTGLTVYVNNQLYDSLYYPIKTTSIPNFGSRTVIINGISFPTGEGAMIGGWEGTHPTQINPGNVANFEFSSTSNSDTINNGSGLRSFTVYGLDASLNPISETIDSSGTTLITLTKSYNHINFVVLETAGNSLGPVGNIIIKTKSPNAIVQYVEITNAFNSSGWFKCPAGYKAILTKINYTSASANPSYITVWRKNKNTYDIHMRFQNQTTIELGNSNEALLILEEGDSCYMFQINSPSSKCVFIYQMIDA
jgi:hypothetical protein